MATAAEPQLKSYFCKSVPLRRVSRILLIGKTTSPPNKEEIWFCSALAEAVMKHAVDTSAAILNRRCLSLDMQLNPTQFICRFKITAF